MAEIWTGAPVAAALCRELAEAAGKMKGQGVTPALAILRLGQRPEDIYYETAAVKRMEKVGVAVRRFSLPADCAREELLEAVRRINMDDSIHGCVMCRPLPDRAMEDAACALLSPEKDVDGMTAGSLAAVFTGRGAGYPPCTAQACIELMDYYGLDLTGRQVAVIGRSLVIGRPVSLMLQARNATVTVCHTKTRDLPSVLRRAEVVIAAAGRAGVVDGRCVSPGQIIVDVGINRDENGKPCGDVKFAEAEPLAAAITPVPGGVGAVTTAVLAKHVIQAAEKALQAR